MSKEPIKTGDQVKFDPNFMGGAILAAPPTVIIGTGTHTIEGVKGCVEGDEKKVMLSPVSYTKGPYVGGTGMLFIDKLAGDQLSKKTKCNGKKSILKGSKFDAKFTVVLPANQPTPSGPVPDTTLQYKGKGEFLQPTDSITVV